MYEPTRLRYQRAFQRLTYANLGLALAILLCGIIVVSLTRTRDYRLGIPYRRQMFKYELEHLQLTGNKKDKDRKWKSDEKSEDSNSKERPANKHRQKLKNRMKTKTQQVSSILDCCHDRSGVWSGLFGAVAAGVGVWALRVASATRQRKFLIAYFVLAILATFASCICFLASVINIHNVKEAMNYALKAGVARSGFGNAEVVLAFLGFAAVFSAIYAICAIVSTSFLCLNWCCINQPGTVAYHGSGSGQTTTSITNPSWQPEKFAGNEKPPAYTVSEGKL